MKESETMSRLPRIAILTAVSLLLTGCDAAGLFGIPKDSDTVVSDHREQRYDTEQAAVLIADLQAAWNSDNEALVRSLKDQLLTASNEACAVFYRAEMQYYADWDSKDLAVLHDQTCQDCCEVNEMVRWAFANAAHKSCYADLFEPLINPDTADYYLKTNLSRVRSAARSDASGSSERLDEYYDAAYRTDTDSESTDAACAELYLQTLRDTDTSDLLYGFYARDYKPDDASAAGRVITAEIVPLYHEILDLVQSDKRYDSLADGSFAVEQPFDMLAKHAAAVSPALGESAEKLIGESLYTTVSGDNCYDGCYTVNFPQEQSARIYFYRGSDFYDFSSAVHEFGHFHADWRDRTPTMLQKTCIDIAEIQSQGLEMLYAHFYDDIYGKDAGYMELIQICNMLDSVVTGFGIGEFEREVMEHKESYSADDVLKAYDRIREENGFLMELYQVTHLYEQPGYYISYGVSALAALQIYSEMLGSFDKAAAMYERIAEIPVYSGEYRLQSALRKCGFRELFPADSVRAVAEGIKGRVAELKQTA